MRDYLFIPLGGDRRGPIRAYANLWIVFLLSGLWHGAAWTFVIWGAYQGLFLILDRLFWGRLVDRLPRLITVPITFFLINIGWAFFRAEDLEAALVFIARLFVPGVPAEGSAPLLMARVVSHRALATMVVAAPHLLPSGVAAPGPGPGSGHRPG